MKTSEILKAAKALIDEPSKWLKGVLATDSEQMIIAPTNKGAVCFCSLGALKHTEVKYRINTSMAYSYLQKSSDCKVVFIYNDEHTHEEVMAMWDRAIKLAEAEESK